MEEVWKDINGFNSLYQASNFGRVRSALSGKIRKPEIGKNGYFIIKLSKGGKKKTINLHRIIANTFLENNENKKCVNHKDGNKLNNHINNLEWVTHSENNLHAFKHFLKKSGEDHNHSKLKSCQVLEIRQMYKKGILQKEIARKFKVTQSLISRVVNHEIWNHIIQA